MTTTVDNLEPRATLSEPRSDGLPERSGSKVGAGAPPPPPAPSPSDGLRSLKDGIRSQQRALREARVRSASQTLRTLHRGYYYAGLAVVAAALLFLGIRWFLQYQRDTTLALADLRGQEAPSTTVAAPVVQEGMPNPLQPLPLSTGAVYVLGANVKTNDKGEAVGFTDLPPLRSTSAMTQLLEGVDLCDAYISLGVVAEVVVTFEPTPGAYPLIDPAAEMCAAAVVSTPNDPIPPTVPTVATVPAS